MDRPYSNRFTSTPYEDTASQTTLDKHREAIQKLTALPSRQAQLAATKNNTLHYRDDIKMNHESKAVNVAATCVNCLSSSSLITCENSLVCSECNKSALIPRVQ